MPLWAITPRQSQRTEVLKLILDYGVDPNVWSKNDVTLLHLHGCTEKEQDKVDIQTALAAGQSHGPYDHVRADADRRVDRWRRWTQ